MVKDCGKPTASGVVVAVMGYQPGIGRTTLINCLATAATRGGTHTVAIDADPNGALTQLQGVRAPEHKSFIGMLQRRGGLNIRGFTTRGRDYDLIAHTDYRGGIVDSVQQCVPNMHPGLCAFRPFRQLRRAYDLVFVDTPASPQHDAGFVAACAADKVLIVSDDSEQGLEAVSAALADIEIVRTEVNVLLSTVAVLLQKPSHPNAASAFQARLNRIGQCVPVIGATGSTVGGGMFPVASDSNLLSSLLSPTKPAWHEVS